MGKNKKSIALVFSFLMLMLAVCACGKEQIKGEEVKNKFAGTEYELYSPDSKSKEAEENMETANSFYNRLLGTFGEKTKDTDKYTVDGRSSAAFPEYYGGCYVNRDGNAVVLIKKGFYSENPESTDWYGNIKPLLKDEQKVLFRECDYSYAELIDEMTKISVSPDFQKARSEADIKSEFACGIDDYSNRISVRATEEDYEKVKKLLTSFVDEKFFTFN